MVRRIWLGYKNAYGYSLAYIRLNGVNAKEHPVFRELSRVKQYFEKIHGVEFGGQKREHLSIDKPAVDRFIKHALVPVVHFTGYRVLFPC